MKKLTVLSLLFVSLTTSYCYDDDAVKKEDKRFEGTWEVIQFEANGQKVPEDVYKNWTFTFKGKKYFQKDGDMLMEAGTQDLDPEKKPMHMDINVTEGDTKDTKQLAIYEWDGDDKVKICAAKHDEKERPKKFETEEGKENMLFTLKRKK